MVNAYIESLTVKNVRQFKHLKVDFNKGFNFIAGPNGCGKTSVLASISHCLDHNNLSYSKTSKESEFWIDLVKDDDKYRVGMGADSVRNSGYRSSSLHQWNLPSSEEGRTSISPHQIKDSLSHFCPLFIGANRSIKYKEIQGMKKESKIDQSFNEYIRNNTKSLYGEWQSDIKQWFVNRYFMIDKDWATEEKVNWEHMLESLSVIAPFDSNFSYVETGKDLEPIFSIYGNKCYLEELSSGFQAVLSIIANIFEWIEGSREDGNRIAKEAVGTVLIDELDLHLHPEWQFTLRDGLETIFPKLQFIVTTHSPHLLASAKSNEVIVMPSNIGSCDFNELHPTKSVFSGWSTDQILLDVMGVVSLENKIYESLITEAFESIEHGSIATLRKIIEQLKAICHPNDTIVMVLNTRLASMVALHNG
ncbi:hypothetical protein CBP31_15070 [Oceanisphaera profunda]|uniref:AAA+ ATPase domain-containing protein n=1 Tax=Oceanisphaera profunda TaxID=1416627 RepID=A0A1Y0D8A5_9GAMM|nr:AAA family ATPase [Oceanisphaera profunda]ART83793.1 hypothetical protein CBP31_15070 [Oceanisphaera profunda]